MLEQNGLVKALEAIEVRMGPLLDQMMHHFLLLNNSPTLAEAKEHLSAIGKGATDLAAMMGAELTKWGCPPTQVRDLRQYAQANLDNLLLNMHHYHQRFVFTEDDRKPIELTAFYYFARDVSEIAAVTAPERYAREVIIP